MSDTGRPDSISIGSEPEFGFAPSIELAGKRGGSSPKMPGKPEFGFAPEIELSAKRDKPPARTPYGRSNHAAQSNAHVLPYEAAMLAASASLAQKFCPNGKLVPVCLAAIVATASVVSGAVVWSAHDDADVSLAPDISTANSDAPETSLLYGDIQRVAQAPKVDILAAAPQTIAPADQIARFSIADDDRVPLPKSSMAYPSTSIDNSAALTSVETNGPKLRRDDAESGISASSSLAVDGPEGILAAASPRSMIDGQAPAMLAQRGRTDGAAGRSEKLADSAALSGDRNTQRLRPHTPELKPLEMASALSPSTAVKKNLFRPAFKPRNIAISTNPGDIAGARNSAVVAVASTAEPYVLVRFWRSLVSGLTSSVQDGDRRNQLLLAANDQNDDDRRGDDDDNGNVGGGTDGNGGGGDDDDGGSSTDGNGGGGDDDDDSGSSGGNGKSGDKGGKGGNGKGGKGDKGGNGKGKK